MHRGRQTEPERELKCPMGKAMIRLLAVFVEPERGLIRERTKASIVRARECSERGGRLVDMTPQRIDRAKEILAAGDHGDTTRRAMQVIAGPKMSCAAY